MDDIKQIEMVHAWWGKVFGKAKGVPNDEKKNREDSLAWKKIVAKYLDWYQTVALKEVGVNESTGRKKYANIPDSSGVKELAEYDAKMIPILKLFNQNGSSRDYVEAFFDDFLEQIRRGWGEKLKAHAERVN